MYTLNKIPSKNYVRFWQWNLKRTSQSAQNSFSRKSFKVLHYIQHDFIFRRLGLSKDQASMFKNPLNRFILKYHRMFHVYAF